MGAGSSSKGGIGSFVPQNVAALGQAASQNPRQAGATSGKGGGLGDLVQMNGGQRVNPEPPATLTASPGMINTAYRYDGPTADERLDRQAMGDALQLERQQQFNPRRQASPGMMNTATRGFGFAPNTFQQPMPFNQFQPQQQFGFNQPTRQQFQPQQQFNQFQPQQQFGFNQQFQPQPMFNPRQYGGKGGGGLHSLMQLFGR
jgi:hypothetical protein